MIYEFAATQDLHGYAKPWAPGAGINFLEPAVYSGLTYNPSVGTTWTPVESAIQPVTEDNINFYITPTVAHQTFTFFAPIDPEGDSYFQRFKAEGARALRVSHGYLDEDHKVLSKTNSTDRTFSNNGHLSPPENAAYRYILVSNYNLIAGNILTISQPMFAVADALPAYSPYANICPPEGYNIWNPTNQEYVQVYAGFVNSNTRELYLRPVYQEYDGEELVGPWMSSMDEYSEDATPTEGAFVIDFGGELTRFEITPFMLQTLLDSLGIRQHFTNGAGLLNSLMDQAQGRVRSEEELLHLSRPLNVIAIGDQLPAGITFKPISKDVLPGLPGKFIR